MKKLTFFAVTFLALVSLLTAVCDMTHIPHALNPDLTDQGGRDISQDERDELERNGHFLKLTYMPPNTQIANVASVSVANSASPVARLNQNDIVRIFRDTDTDTSTVYLPLVYTDGSEFTETGSFFIAFVIHVDALTSYIVNLDDKIIVPFTDGRGALDVRSLPVSGFPGNPPQELTENERDELERTGHFLKLTYMPPNTQIANVASVAVANSVSTVAALDRNLPVRIFREEDTSTVYIPLVYFDNSEFTETGSFYTAFAVHVDAITSYVVTVADKILVPFTDGRGSLDVRSLPYGGIVASDRRYLTIYNLPPNLLAQNVSNVSVNNQYSPVARCENYSFVEVSSFSGSSTVSIPLSFVNSPNTAFSGTGSFYVAFDIFIDAVTHFSASAADCVLVYFLNGNGYLDINDLPAAEHRFLTITGLPPNLLAQNVSNVMILNQSAPVAQCEDYNLLEVSVSDGKASVRIPLAFINPASMFSGNGNFFVTFNINIDADTRYIAAAADGITVFFTNGSGTLDINNIPKKLIPYLTIKNLPAYTKTQHISNVNVYSLAGTVASCSDYNDIVIVPLDGKITALIPLSDSSVDGFFYGTGRFAISFSVTVDFDAGNRIIVSQNHNIVLDFNGGSAVFDTNELYGHFVADLVIPLDTQKPVIKAGSSFDIDGVLHSVSSNLDVPASPTGDFSGVIFLYAYRLNDNVFYEFSSTRPEYNPIKKGFYKDGVKRALWQMVYLQEKNLFLFPVKAGEPFPQLKYYTLTDSSYDLLINKKDTNRSMSGESNPMTETFTLQPGVYAVKLVGAGGGAGAPWLQVSTNGDPLATSTEFPNGGSGGSIAEIFTLETATAFSAFTGSGGGSGSIGSLGLALAGFNVYGTRNNDLSTNSALLGLSFVGVGGGGGGGGSGTFLYSQAPAPNSQGYFLCVGGGGGGSGSSLLTPGGAGGAGGSVGSGGGGGSAGYLLQYITGNLANIPVQLNTVLSQGGNGGKGGGYNGGSGGLCSVPPTLAGPFTGFNGGDGTQAAITFYNIINSAKSAASYDEPYLKLAHNHLNDYSYNPVTYYSISPAGGNGGSAHAVLFAPGGSDSWLSVNNANGQGADSPPLPEIVYVGYFMNVYPADGYNGSDGGNNRTLARGDGAPGGNIADGHPDGSPGSFTIHTIYLSPPP